MTEGVYNIVCIAVFGLIFGSFLNCMAMRIVRNEDFVKDRSRCRDCGHKLGAIDLIPVLSYVLSRGKCRYCGKKISVRYPVTELIFMFLSVFLYAFTKPDMLLFCKNWVLTGCLFAMALVDLEILEIPDGLLITAFFNWVVFSLLEVVTGDWSIKDLGFGLLAGVIAGAVMLTLSLIMDRILKRDSLGGGDIKLFAILGLYLGFAGAYELVILSCVLGLMFAMARKIIDPKATKEFPFGPAIATASYILLIIGNDITDWYLRML